MYLVPAIPYLVFSPGYILWCSEYHITIVCYDPDNLVGQFIRFVIASILYRFSSSFTGILDLLCGGVLSSLLLELSLSPLPFGAHPFTLSGRQPGTTHILRSYLFKCLSPESCL